MLLIAFFAHVTIVSASLEPDTDFIDPSPTLDIGLDQLMQINVHEPLNLHALDIPLAQVYLFRLAQSLCIVSIFAYFYFFKQTSNLI